MKKKSIVLKIIINMHNSWMAFKEPRHHIFIFDDVVEI